jgi:hypothetical protein
MQAGGEGGKPPTWSCFSGLIRSSPVSEKPSFLPGGNPPAKCNSGYLLIYCGVDYSFLFCLNTVALANVRVSLLFSYYVDNYKFYHVKII